MLAFLFTNMSYNKFELIATNNTLFGDSLGSTLKGGPIRSASRVFGIAMQTAGMDQ